LFDVSLSLSRNLKDLASEWLIRENGTWRLPKKIENRKLSLLRKDSVIFQIERFLLKKESGVTITPPTPEILAIGLEHYYKMKKYYRVFDVYKYIPLDKIPLSEANKINEIYKKSRTIAPSLEKWIEPSVKGEKKPIEVTPIQQKTKSKTDDSTSYHDKLIDILATIGHSYGNFEVLKKPKIKKILPRTTKMSKEKILDLGWKIPYGQWIAFEVQVHGSVEDLMMRMQLVSQYCHRMVVVYSKPKEREYIQEIAKTTNFEPKLVLFSDKDILKAEDDFSLWEKIKGSIFEEK